MHWTVLSSRIRGAPALAVVRLLVLALLPGVLPGAGLAQVRMLPLGDSITQGGQGYVSYRYELWFDLQNDGYDVDFVGLRDFTNDDPPNAAWYPEYYGTFDRDHEAYWGYRTDEIAPLVPAAAAATQPDVALIHLGTNDVGQMGAAGVVNADTYLRQIIGSLRAANPDITMLLARNIPIGGGNGYSANAGQIDSLHAVVEAIVADSTTAQSPLLLVDAATGFDLGTMMQPDSLHPNLAGEAFLADQWRAVLATFLPAGNPRPSVTLTAPADGAEFTEGDPIGLTADASDPNGTVVEVRFYAGAAPLGSSPGPTFALDWIGAPVGVHVLTAEAEDDQGAVSTSDSITVTVLPPGAVSVAVSNPSFEIPALGDSGLAPGPGVVGDWTFSGTTNTFVGIFNPPEGSYPGAGGNGTPAGADGANVAYLFNDGGPNESVAATQVLAEALAADTEYTLRVAIGRFLPDQPYSYSEYGGYVIELRAGGTPLGSDTGTVEPPFGEFREAQVVLEANDFDPQLLGLPLTIALGIASTSEDRSTHFDDVRLLRRDLSASAIPAPGGPAPVLSAAPNPFSRSTEITYLLSLAAIISIDVYDVAGRRVDRLLGPEHRPAGFVRVRFDAPQAGVYFLRVRTGEGDIATKRVVKIR